MVTATDNVGVAGLGLTVGGTPVVLDAQGRATVPMTAVGVLNAVATATDASGNIGQTTILVSVFDPSDADAPLADLTSPADGATITSPTDVIGSVQDDNLLYYTLSIAPLGSDFFTEIARGTQNVASGVLGKFDPSTLANDTYVLRLYAKDAGGLETTLDREVSVAGNLKLGEFTLSFTDLSIPVAGIPITVSRTYDSFNAGRAVDFGYGWRMEFVDTQLRTTVATTGMEEDGIYNSFSDGTRVYVTLPGGKREGFTFRPQLAPGFKGSLLGICLPKFVADAGVTDELAVPSYDLCIGPEGEIVDFGSGLAYNPSSPLFGGSYVLTTKDGIAYDIDGNTGKLRTVTDPNANVLAFSESGISSSTGTQVAFERDPQGAHLCGGRSGRQSCSLPVRCPGRSGGRDRSPEQHDDVRVPHRSGPLPRQGHRSPGTDRRAQRVRCPGAGW